MLPILLAAGILILVLLIPIMLHLTRPVAVLADVLVLVKETATDIVPVVVEMMDVALTANQLDAEEMDVGKVVFMIVLLVVGQDIN